MNVQKCYQMIGTSISIQNTGEMQYPSITICENVRSGADVFGDGQFFDSYDDYARWKYGNSSTPVQYYDLKDLFLGLSTMMPNMSTFMLDPRDIDDRDVTLCSQSHIRKRALHYKKINFSHLYNFVNLHY